MGKHIHVLDRSTIDIEARKVVCRNCGPIDLYISSGGNIRCGTAYRENLTDQSSRPTPKRLSLDTRTASFLRKLVGSCQLCGTAENLQVDHDHKTEEIRGVVCGSCNRWIASMDKIGEERALSLLTYLGWHPCPGEATPDA